MAIETIAVIGAGTMGHGIAQVAAQAGYAVVLSDMNDELVARGLARIDDNLKKGIERGKLTEAARGAALSRIRTTTALEEIAAADLVIEAVIEKLDAKRDLCNRLDRLCKPETVLATNTSSLSIAAIAEATSRGPLLNPPSTRPSPLPRASAKRPSSLKTCPALRPAGSASRSDSKRCVCSNSRSPAPKTLIKRWRSATTIRWGLCG